MINRPSQPSGAVRVPQHGCLLRFRYTHLLPFLLWQFGEPYFKLEGRKALLDVIIGDR
jgi:hypothetical protein